MKQRDSSVELLRLIACIIVVLIHSRSSTLVIDGASYGRTLIACFLADGVSIFWLITGFFYLKSNQYKLVLKRGFLRVALPATILMMLCLVLTGWINGQATIAQSIESFKISDFSIIIKAWLVGNSSMIASCGHLWYVFMYIMVLLWFPLLKRFDTKDKSINQQKWVLLAITFVYIIIDTWSDRFEFLNFINVGYFRIIPVAVFLVLIGDEIYRNLNKIKGNWVIRIASLGVFIITNIVRSIDQFNIFANYQIEGKVIFWYSLYGVVSAVSLSLFILSFNVKEGIISKCVTWIAQFTFPIYLIHYVICGILYNHTDSFRYGIFEFFDVDNSGSLHFMGFVVVYGIIVFIMSLLISIVIRYTKKMLLSLWRAIYKGNKNAKKI